MSTENTSEKIIKIKLLQSEQLKTYKKELKRWEAEGGNPSRLNDVLKELEKPVEPGDKFEVVEGNVISDEDEFLYQVQIRKLES